MMNHKSCFRIGGMGLAIAATLIVATASQGEPVPSRTKPASVQAAREQWNCRIKVLVDATDRRAIAVRDAAYDMGGAAASLLQQADHAGFSREAVSVSSLASWKLNPQSWRRWLSDQYYRMVFPVATYQTAVLMRVSQLNDELNAINSDAIVEMELDVEYEPIAFDRSSLRFSVITTAVEEAIESTVVSIRNANAAKGGGAIMGGLVGMAAERAYATRQTQDSDWSQRIGGFLIGAAAGAVAEAVVEKASQKSNAVPAVLSRSVEGLRVRLGVNGAASADLVQQMVAMSTQHEAKLFVVAFRASHIEYEEAKAMYFAARTVHDEIEN